MKKIKEFSYFINKPWGSETILALNDHYCYKMIFINAGHRTSLQYHEEKIETNYLTEGQIILELENDGSMEARTLSPGEYFSVARLQKHRITALTDAKLLEVSTPQVDDVIRVEDDAGRPNGRIDSEHE